MSKNGNQRMVKSYLQNVEKNNHIHTKLSFKKWAKIQNFQISIAKFTTNRLLTKGNSKAVILKLVFKDAEINREAVKHYAYVTPQQF